LRTPEDVQKTIEDSKGTVMVVVNSICAAQRERLGRELPGTATQRAANKVATVFAGADIELPKKRAATLPATSPLRLLSRY